MGDVLLITPLLRALRARHPGATISALTRSAYAPLLSENPHLDEVLSLDSRQSIAALGRELRGRDYTHLLDLHGSLRSRVLRLLVPGRWCGYNARRPERRTLIKSKRDRYRGVVPVAERYFEAARCLDVTPDGAPAEFHLNPVARETADRWLADRDIDIGRRFVVMAPGAAHATKRWPAEHWRSLVKTVTAAGSRVVVMGGAQDEELCRNIASVGNGAAAWVAGELGFQESGALVAAAVVLVSGAPEDMHMAAAGGTPVVTVFGPIVEQYDFFPYRAAAIVLQRDLGCRPCSAKGTPRCPLVHHRCLREIVPATVEAAMAELTA